VTYNPVAFSEKCQEYPAPVLAFRVDRSKPVQQPTGREANVPMFFLPTVRTHATFDHSARSRLTHANSLLSQESEPRPVRIHVFRMLVKNMLNAAEPFIFGEQMLLAADDLEAVVKV
jgi:hypothetical protein